MSNKYYELKQRHEKSINEFPMMFAFSNEQFNEGMKKLGLEPTDTDKIYSIGAGGFIKKSDSEALDNLFKRNVEELQNAINEDLTGESFIYQMFLYELNNHEYSYTYDLSDTLDALGYTYEDIEKDIKLLTGLNKAKNYIREMDI